MSSETENSASQVVSIPASVLPVQDIAVIQAYINSTKFCGFSIQHDISTPGVGILASYSLVASPTVDPLDKRSVR
ncbi:hypothetical protein LguiB_016128 [Lonicera macranthoides]